MYHTNQISRKNQLLTSFSNLKKKTEYTVQWRLFNQTYEFFTYYRIYLPISLNWIGENLQTDLILYTIASKTMLLNFHIIF